MKTDLFVHFICTKKFLKSGDGLVGVDEYRLDCVSRAAFANIKEIDDAFDKLLTVSEHEVKLYCLII